MSAAIFAFGHSPQFRQWDTMSCTVWRRSDSFAGQINASAGASFRVNASITGFINILRQAVAPTGSYLARKFRERNEAKRASNAIAAGFSSSITNAVLITGSTGRGNINRSVRNGTEHVLARHFRQLTTVGGDYVGETHTENCVVASASHMPLRLKLHHPRRFNLHQPQFLPDNFPDALLHEGGEFHLFAPVLRERRGSEHARKVERERVTVGVLACSSFPVCAEILGRERQASPVTLSRRSTDDGWAASTAEGPQCRGSVRPLSSAAVH